MSSVIKTVAKHSVIYGLGDLASKSIGFAMIPVYTHYLSTAQYGVLELVDLTSYVLGLLLAMGISQSVVRFYYEYPDTERKHQVISIALITIWVVSAVALLPLYLFSKDVSVLVFNSPDYSRLFNIVFISVMVNLSNDIPMTLLRIQEKSVLYIVISISKLAICLTLNIIFVVHLELGVIGILLSGVIGNVLAGLFLLVYTLRQIRLTYSFKIARAMLVFGLPMVGSMFGMYVLNFGDRFFLQRLTTMSDVGIYSLAYKFGMMSNALLLTPFQMIWAPKRFEIVSQPDAKQTFALVFTYYWFVQLFLFLGVGALCRDIIAVVADKEYQGASQYVPVIMLAYVFFGAYLYVQFGILLKKKTKYLAMNTMVAAVVNVIANFTLIPILGTWGAALATAISFFILFVSVQFIAQRLYHIPYQIGRLVKMTLVAALLYGVTSLINPTNVAISIASKSLIVLFFPLALYGVKFYTPVEIQQLSLAYGRAIHATKSFLRL
jgi:O-antigen/teichoic acid export membrane protein